MRLRALFAGLALMVGLHGAATAQTLGAGDASAMLARCDTDLVRLNQLTGWQAQWSRELDVLAGRSPQERTAALPRWRAALASLDTDLVALERRRAAGTTAPAPVVRRVVAQIEALTRGPIAPNLKDPEWRAFLDHELKRKVAAYGDYLRGTYLPAAGEKSDLSTTEAGHLCFTRAATGWTSRSLPPAEIEAIGRRLLARYQAELQALEGIGADDVPVTLQRLRSGKDSPKASRDDILRISQDAIDRAIAASPAWFEQPIHTPLKVEPIPEALEATLPAGLYSQASGDRPAAYLINLSRPSERRLMAEVIAFHEGVPGHHFAFGNGRAGTFNSGFVEGWGIYAEHLADEMGLYSGKQDRLGMVTKHLWAASRLVVEPGLHVHGWTRDQAVAFMLENTALPRTEIEIEVDRYLAMPGQSLAYMIGYETLREARERVRRGAGDSFDIRAFHRRVLEPGPRPLDDLAREFP